MRTEAAQHVAKGDRIEYCDVRIRADVEIKTSSRGIGDRQVCGLDRDIIAVNVKAVGVSSGHD